MPIGLLPRGPVPCCRRTCALGWWAIQVNAEFLGALEDLERERGIDKEVLLEAIEAALISAYRRNFGGASPNVRVHLDRTTGEPEVFQVKNVVLEVAEPRAEISLQDARLEDPSMEVGDVV